MTKIDKIDLENIKIIRKETKINNISKIKIKKAIMKLNYLPKELIFQILL